MKSNNGKDGEASFLPLVGELLSSTFSRSPVPGPRRTRCGRTASRGRRGTCIRASRAGLASLLALCLLSSCGGKPQLGGSLGESYDLTFEQIRARLYPTELSIEYVRENGEVLVGLSVRTTDTGLEGPATVDLDQFGSLSGSLDGNDIPELLSGTLYLRSYAPEEGAEVRGDFEALLEGTRGELTLHGEFEAELDVVY